MPKFVFVYHAPMTPAEATPPAPEQMEAVMGAWNAWAAKVGDDMVDFGTPLAGGVRVAPGGATTPSERDVAGYTIIEAETMESALGLAKAHPHLEMPGGCEIEVHEARRSPACSPVWRRWRYLVGNSGAGTISSRSWLAAAD